MNKWINKHIGDRLGWSNGGSYSLHSKSLWQNRSRWGMVSSVSKPKTLEKHHKLFQEDSTSARFIPLDLSAQTREKHELLFCRQENPHLLLQHITCFCKNDQRPWSSFFTFKCGLWPMKTAFQKQISDTTGRRKFMVWEVPNGVLTEVSFPSLGFHSSDKYWRCDDI